MLIAFSLASIEASRSLYAEVVMEKRAVKTGASPNADAATHKEEQEETSVKDNEQPSALREISEHKSHSPQNFIDAFRIAETRFDEVLAAARVKRRGAFAGTSLRGIAWTWRDSFRTSITLLGQCNAITTADKMTVSGDLFGVVNLAKRTDDDVEAYIRDEAATVGMWETTLSRRLGEFMEAVNAAHDHCAKRH
jgi:hypothetical protein